MCRRRQCQRQRENCECGCRFVVSTSCHTDIDWIVRFSFSIGSRHRLLMQLIFTERSDFVHCVKWAFACFEILKWRALPWNSGWSDKPQASMQSRSELEKSVMRKTITNGWRHSHTVPMWAPGKNKMCETQSEREKKWWSESQRHNRKWRVCLSYEWKTVAACYIIYSFYISNSIEVTQDSLDYHITRSIAQADTRMLISSEFRDIISQQPGHVCACECVSLRPQDAYRSIIVLFSICRLHVKYTIHSYFDKSIYCHDTVVRMNAWQASSVFA